MAKSAIGIIPAAGRGSRIGLPYPKELLPITYSGGQIITVLESNILQLAEAGIEEAIVIVSPQKAIIPQYLGNSRYGVTLHYRDQKTWNSREGLPDAVLAGRSLAERYDLVVMLMADVYFTSLVTTTCLVEAMRQRPSVAAGVVTWHTDTPERFGIVGSENNQVLWVADKPTSMELPYRDHWGAVAFRAPFWSFLQEERNTFSHALDRACNQYDIIRVRGQGSYMDLGTPKSLIDSIVEVNML